MGQREQDRRDKGAEDGTLFIRSRLAGPGRATGVGGFDASHSGGAPGFVTVQDDGSLLIPDKVRESAGITSFHLAPANGPVPRGFEAGQHLPVRLNIPGHAAAVERSYSLSGSPTAPTWRISVKREAHGIASRFLHDRTGIGDEIDARPTQGDFTLPPDDRPRFLSAP